jgi:hypothetical protein
VCCDYRPERTDSGLVRAFGLDAANRRSVTCLIGRHLAVVDTAAPAAFVSIRLRCKERGRCGPDEQDQKHEAGDATAHNS